MTLGRRKRQLKILELVATRPMRTQEDLVEALRQEGWDVTQSSVSRDVSQLGLVKVEGIYTRAVASGITEVSDPNERRLAESVLSVDTAGEALLVLHTPPGEAHRAGNALDLLAWDEVVGTIAGDDTIFVAVVDADAQRTLVRRVRTLLGRETE